MSVTLSTSPKVSGENGKYGNLWKRIWRHKWFYLLMLPGVVWLLIFHIAPLWGIVISFQDFNPILGVLGSEWVGLENYKALLQSRSFYKLLTNTIYISGLKLLFCFPAPIILALCINEVKGKYFKKVVQTVSYLPNFLTWVVVSGICYVIFNDYYGVIKGLCETLGMGYSDITQNPKTFIPFLVFASVWKTMGMNSIIYLSALSGLDQEMYEAAKIDGANKWQELTRITIPCLMPTCAVMLILSVGGLLSGDFEQIYLFAGENSRLIQLADVFETYVYRNGIRAANFSFPAAVGMFQSVVGCLLVLITNKLAKLMGNEGIW